VKTIRSWSKAVCARLPCTVPHRGPHDSGIPFAANVDDRNPELYATAILGTDSSA